MKPFNPMYDTCRSPRRIPRLPIAARSRPWLLCLVVCLASMGRSAHAVDGNLVFSTDRDGNYEIYSMTPAGASATNLTNNPAADRAPAWNGDSSRIAFYSNRAHSGGNTLFLMPAAGSAAPTDYFFHAGNDTNPAWDPNSTTLYFTTDIAGSGNLELWQLDTSGPAPSGMANRTSRDGTDDFACFSPDGSRIVFASQRNGDLGNLVADFNIWVMDSNGSNRVQLTTSPGDDIHPRWSRDGSKIIFASNRSGNYDLYAITPAGTGETQLTTTPANETWPALAPSGLQIAYQSDSAGNNDIWVADLNLAANAISTPVNRTAASVANDIEPNWSSAAEASSLVVTRNDDVVSTIDDQTSLREALSYAASLGGAQTVTFSPALGGATIGIGTTGDASNGNSAFLITNEITIQAPTGGVTIASAVAPASLRAFLVAGTGSLTLNGVRLQGFGIIGAPGTTVLPDGLNGEGGTIYNNAGTVTLVNSTIAGSSATGGQGNSQFAIPFNINGAGGNGNGGAIYNNGTLILEGSTLMNNVATGGAAATSGPEPAPDGAGNGGAIANAGTMTIANSTISGNSATTGGGLDNVSGVANLASATVTANTATTDGAGISVTGGTVEIDNTIVAGNTGNDIAGTVVSPDSTFNLVGAASGGLTDGVGGNIVGATPHLGALASNGGPTMTHTLQYGSPAINAGETALATDQRGLARPQGSIDDIGAVEAQSLYVLRGYIRTNSLAPIAGVSVQVSTSGGAAGPPVTTDANGFYQVNNVPNGGYLVTATLADWSFSPASQSLVVSNSVRSANFIGARTAAAYSISGRIYNGLGQGIAGVSVALVPDVTGVHNPIVTNSAGYFAFTNVPPGDYTVTPTKSGVMFNLASRNVSVTNANIASQNFVGASGYTVTGRLQTSGGVSIAGASVQLDAGPAVLTNSAGYYTLYDVPNGAHTITPSKAGVTFLPAVRNIVINNSNLVNLGFIGSGP